MFKGSIVALVTPMDTQNNVDYDSLETLINYHIKNGTSAIVALGTTGEASTLSQQEKLKIIKYILEISNKRIPIIAGTGSNSTSEAISFTRLINNSGISGCLSVVPYYNRPNQEGLYQHFLAIAKSSHLPLILYNIPIRTGCDMIPATVARLSKIPNIIGIKETSGNLSRVSQIQELVNDDFILLSGDDESALDFIRLGGQGVISVTANIAAYQMSQMCHLLNTGNFIKANLIQKQLMPLHKQLFIDPNPVPVKWACKKLGLIKHNNVRLPLISLHKTGVEIVNKALIDSKLI